MKKHTRQINDTALVIIGCLGLAALLYITLMFGLYTR